METGEIVQMFAESGFQIDPLALDLMKTSSPELIHDVLKSIDNSVMVVRIEHINHRFQKTGPETAVQPGTSKTIPQKPDIIPSKVKPDGNPVTILKDITNQSTCIGEYTEFVHYFRDRYDSIAEMLRRIGARPIESIKKRNMDTREPLSIIGMVLDIRSTGYQDKRKRA
ncbi:MAG: hypothetical protein O8C64_12885 [Candidatus Methanoperedens sp.]|nr:hypothetical protein [Candidatus Methanoperedens sp.]